MYFLKSNKNSKKMTIAIAAGGTGGHIFPALTIAKILIQNGFYVLFYTDKNFFKYFEEKENTILRSGMIEVIQLKARNAPRILQVFMILKDFFSCRKILTKRVSLCVGFGGLVSFAPMLFGILTFKKIIIHEQNAVIGLANRLILPFATKCLLSFKDTLKIKKSFLKKCVFVGNPIRDEIKKLVFNYDNPSVNYMAFYKIDKDIDITITIIGGSQACEFFDNMIQDAISLLPQDILSRLNVIHQCKAINIEKLDSFYSRKSITHTVSSFFRDIGEILRASHLVISRAGSTTIAEISSLGVPTILIPLPSAADNHQFYNAKFLRDNNAAILLEQNSLTKEILSQLLLDLFKNDQKLFELSKSCRNLANINADIAIFNEIKKTLGMEEEKYNDNSDLNIKNARYINDNVGLG